MKLTLINCSVVEAEGGGTLAKGMNKNGNFGENSLPRKIRRHSLPISPNHKDNTKPALCNADVPSPEVPPINSSLSQYLHMRIS